MKVISCFDRTKLVQAEDNAKKNHYFFLSIVKAQPNLPEGPQGPKGKIHPNNEKTDTMSV